jgi:hypothetical protein
VDLDTHIDLGQVSAFNPADALKSPPTPGRRLIGRVDKGEGVVASDPMHRS